MSKKGILLINIGSPRSYQVKDVKAYLKRFLMDKWIIDLPYPLRWILVNLLILPKRSPFSAKNYQRIWTADGSPLIVYSEKFRQKLQKELGEDFDVRTGMCFSQPDILESLQDLQKKNLDSILAIPLFPQYAGATTGSVTEALDRAQKQIQLKTPLKILGPFYKQAGFVENSAKIAQDSLKNKKVQHYVFSFHGLPEKQVIKMGCQIKGACKQLPHNCVPNCYRSQCYDNARLLAQALHLTSDQWSIAFQSRLGRAEWLKPSTDFVLEDLAKRGIQDVAVLCPSFVADCIETLEEIGMGATEDFQGHGGKNIHLVPCVNDDDQWVRDFADLCRQQVL